MTTTTYPLAEAAASATAVAVAARDDRWTICRNDSADPSLEYYSIVVRGWGEYVVCHLAGAHGAAHSWRVDVRRQGEVKSSEYGRTLDEALADTAYAVTRVHVDQPATPNAIRALYDFPRRYRRGEFDRRS